MSSSDVKTEHPLYKSEKGYQEIMKWYHDLLDQIDIEYQQIYLDTEYGCTHIIVSGPEEAEPLFLVQAVAGSAPLWRNQLQEFSRHFRVYAIDTLGQPGLSDEVPLSYLKGEYTKWLIDILDKLNIPKANFIGVSTGGWQVMHLSLEAPERVHKAILLSPMGLCHARLPVKIWFTKMLKKSKDVDALQDDLTARSVTSKSPGGSFGTFDRQLARAMALCTRHFRVDRSMGIYNEKTKKIEKMNALRVLRKFFLSEPKSKLRRLKKDTLIIFGEHEVLYNPKKVTSRMKRLVPDVKMEIMNGAGHAVIYDKPKEANEMILEFLLN